MPTPPPTAVCASSGAAIGYVACATAIHMDYLGRGFPDGCSGLLSCYFLSSAHGFLCTIIRALARNKRRRLWEYAICYIIYYI